jgi:hypothetical protein
MFKKFIVRNTAIVFLSLLVLSCQKEEEIDLSNINLLSVSFQKANNPSLVSDIKLDFDNEETFSGFVPYGTSLHSLIATYEFEGSSVQIDGEEQTNSVSSNDFGKERVVSVLDERGNGKDYLIRLHYHTGLPIVFLDIFDPESVPREEYITAEISVYGGLDFPDIENTAIEIRGRGNSTWWGGQVEKKPYQIKFSDKQEVLGMADDRRWVLLAEHYDPSMIRNKLSFEMGKMSNFVYSPQGEYVEVFINDQPQGTYVLAQKVEESKNRLDIGNNGYLIEMDQRHRVYEDDVYFEPPIFRERAQKFGSWLDTIFNIKEPADIQHDSQAHREIENVVNAFEEVLFGDNFKDPEAGYRNYIDVDSFIDWYLINEIGKSVDAYGYASVFFSYVPGEKIKMGPVWDFDLSYGNADYAFHAFSGKNAFFPAGNWINEHPWIERLLEDDYFKQKVIERYTYFYDKRDEFMALIDQFSDQINRSQALNYELYENLGQEIWNNSSAIFQTHAEEVEYLKSWLFERINWMNGNL